ncbi:MAG TPA: RIO1 family regulatory kinase/ATPase [Acidimicrobiales bacterium]|nr:RIO1 family regulatory kinase/ATPase [Acidimicrobiales bacterium]
MRPQPDWLITEDVDYAEFDLGPLKTGKEAEVFLVERTHEDRSCLLAHKRYRPRSVTHKGELEALGFQRANAFMNDRSYRDGRTFAKSRDRRAAERATKYGKRLLADGWTGHELDVMRRLWEVGVNVPYPVGERDDGLLMQFVGDRGAAAPRLAQARLDSADLALAATQMLANLRLIVGAGFVHADLSAYNLLWWHGEIWVIDLPQTVDIAINPQALDFLQRDVTNVATWFSRRGVAMAADDLFAELVTIACAL